MTDLLKYQLLFDENKIKRHPSKYSRGISSQNNIKSRRISALSLPRIGDDSYNNNPSHLSDNLKENHNKDDSSLANVSFDTANNSGSIKQKNFRIYGHAKSRLDKDFSNLNSEQSSEEMNNESRNEHSVDFPKLSNREISPTRNTRGEAARKKATICNLKIVYRRIQCSVA